MCNKSDFNWEKVFDGLILDAKFENPSVLFANMAHKGAYDTVSDKYYNALLAQTESVSDFFDDRAWVFGISFFRGLVFTLLMQQIDKDNIALILKRFVWHLFYLFSNGTFILDGVHSGFSFVGDSSVEQIFGVPMRWRLICYSEQDDSLVDMLGKNNGRYFDLYSAMKREIVRVCAENENTVSAFDAMRDFIAFARNRFLSDLFLRLGLSGYCDISDWSSFESEVRKRNEERGLVKQYPELWGLVHSVAMDFVKEATVEEGSAEDELLTVELIGCHLREQSSLDASAGLIKVHPGSMLVLSSDSWSENGPDWVHAGIINGMSLKDILESSRIEWDVQNECDIAAADGFSVCDIGNKFLYLIVNKDIKVQYCSVN